MARLAMLDNSLPEKDWCDSRDLKSTMVSLFRSLRWGLNSEPEARGRFVLWEKLLGSMKMFELDPVVSEDGSPTPTYLYKQAKVKEQKTRSSC